MQQITQKTLDIFYKSLSLKTDSTQEVYSYIVNKFISESKGIISKDNILSFIMSYPKNSRLTVYYAIKFFCKTTGIEFDIKHSDIAPKGVQKIREVMSYDEIVKLIEYCKNINSYVSGIFALSTTYGLRRTEIINIKKDDIDLDNKKINITVLKAVESKYTHRIPDEIIPYLDRYMDKINKVNKMNPPSLNRLFDTVVNDAGIELRPRLGFHSIRRSLVIELSKRNVNRDVIETFMRWKSMIRSMVDVYNIVDREYADNTVFENHPFLPLWKNIQNS